jgi:IMP cyclohydrolase
MKHVDSLEKADAATPQAEEVLFGRTGQINTGKNEKVYAKVVSNRGNLAYYIKTYNSELFDPLGIYAKREHILETKFSRVEKATFDFYMVYLKTNKSIYFTKAQRGYINS